MVTLDKKIPIGIFFFLEKSIEYELIGYPMSYSISTEYSLSRYEVIVNPLMNTSDARVFIKRTRDLQRRRTNALKFLTGL